METLEGNCLENSNRVSITCVVRGEIYTGEPYSYSILHYGHHVHGTKQLRCHSYFQTDAVVIFMLCARVV